MYSKAFKLSQKYTGISKEELCRQKYSFRIIRVFFRIGILKLTIASKKICL